LDGLAYRNAFPARPPLTLISRPNTNLYFWAEFVGVSTRQDTALICKQYLSPVSSYQLIKLQLWRKAYEGRGICKQQTEIPDVFIPLACKLLWPLRKC
jgi:hypothetical protein